MMMPLVNMDFTIALSLLAERWNWAKAGRDQRFVPVILSIHRGQSYRSHGQPVSKIQELTH